MGQSRDTLFKTARDYFFPLSFPLLSSSLFFSSISTCSSRCLMLALWGSIHRSVSDIDFCQVHLLTTFNCPPGAWATWLHQTNNPPFAFVAIWFIGLLKGRMCLSSLMSSLVYSPTTCDTLGLITYSFTIRMMNNFKIELGCQYT